MTLPVKSMFLQIGSRRYQVDSYRQASEMFCAVRDRMGEGASKTPSPHIVDESGAVIGYVAYNGRVFAGKSREWTSATPLLFDNRVEGAREGVIEALGGMLAAAI